MAVVTVCALVGAACAAGLLGGGQGTVVRVITMMAIASVATFAPAVLNVGREYWGVCVLASGMVRSLICLGWAYATMQMASDVQSRPLMIGAATGVAIVLAAETALSVAILSRIERARSSASPRNHPTTASEQV